MKPKPILIGAVIAALALVILPITHTRANATPRDVRRTAISTTQDQPQAANADDPKFAKFVYDVVSIKPFKGDDPKATVHWMGMQDSPDGITMHNAPFTVLIAQAYRTAHSRLAGAPDWLNSERYDVEAKMEPEAADAFQKLSPADQKLARQHMLRVLARDYLKLTFHMETTEVSVYELVVGKNGSKLNAPSDPNVVGRGMTVSGSGGATRWDGKNLELTAMMGQLSYVMGRPVYDKTGLTGKYDFTLKYTPDRPGTAAPGPDSAAPPDEAPPITIAIEEQLGLKLVPGKGPMDSIVIDHVEKPALN
jgi:uncharacterized protein (TIGR03435 family)